jgi:disulfide oxidoreductase YuzD
MLYSEFLDKATRSNRRKAGLLFLKPRAINKKFSYKGIDTENLRDKSMEELATITGADMVLIVIVKKNRLISDGAAIGKDVAESVLNSLFKTDNTNNVATKT